MTEQSIGLIGLGVMGQNLALNIARHGYPVVAHDVDAAKARQFVAERVAGAPIAAADSITDLTAALPAPRIVMLMVPAGAPVDACLDALLPQLAGGDIIIDCGNSHFADTNRRVAMVEAAGKLYVGAGVSGGEEGALRGPSVMPGGSPAARARVLPLLRTIAARLDDGTPCCDWIGPAGAGHFVKMVHNGIEYGDMQLICEAYDLLRRGAGLTLDQLRDAFDQYNRGPLASYLIEITRDILAHRTDGRPTLDLILDTAGQKGTGKWTAVAALQIGQPLTLIGEAVFARFLSSLKEQRVAAAPRLPGPEHSFSGDRATLVDHVGQALYASKIVSYAQGYQLLHAISAQQDWPLNYGGIALTWRGGCIIRSVFLGRIKEAFDRDPTLTNLLLDEFFGHAVADAQSAWRRVVQLGVELGIPLPAMSSALAYYDGYRTARLPANLLQAQRDYFGAHTYERVDRPRGEFFHTQWSAGDGDM